MKLEGEILSSLNHPNIISFVQYSDSAVLKLANGGTRRAAVLLTEFGRQGDFSSFLERTGPLPENIARTYFRQVVECVEFIHEKKLCHFDIKPENFVLDDNFHLKLCDFGCSMAFNSTDSFRGIIGTNEYLAPEAFLDQFYSGRKIDIFSCGVLLFVMVVGHYPFEKACREDPLYNLICQRQYDRFWAIHKELAEKAGRTVELSEELRDLIIQMLKKYPSDRISLKAMKEHPWMKGPSLNSDQLSRFFRK